MTPLGWLAAIVLFLQLPIPLYWFVVHPHVHFWRRHGNAGYITGLLLSWGAVTPCLVIFRRQFFRNNLPPVWEIIPGLALIVVEGWIFLRVKHDLGGARLVGATELSGGGEIVHRGIYAHIRHPRYIGSFFAVLGACLIAGTGIMWTATAVWLLLTLVAIELEEREMRARFGAAYEAYCRRVPRFLPLRAKPRES
ncbi:MAG TPA: isoprenylcysteine carboxylmethyltransferase family protein [Candidatus Angelobacter sp.]|nr:isoprenylcysteine carboxylmethyltransferase family protein [Candidatus Angelobacter sp.]